MIPGRYDMELRAGASFNLLITYDDEAGEPMDLAGFTGRMQIRTALNGSLLHELTTENGGIVLGSGEGNIKLSMPGTATAELLDGLYDLFIYSGEHADCVIEGAVKVARAVTR